MTETIIAETIIVSCPACGSECLNPNKGSPVKFTCNTCGNRFRAKPAKRNKRLTKTQKQRYIRHLHLWLKLRDELWRTTGCAIQHGEYPCGTCTSGVIRELKGVDSERMYDAVFAFRGDYNPDKLAHVYGEEFASNFRFTEAGLHARIKRLLNALDFVPSLEQRRAKHKRSTQLQLANLPESLTIDEFDNKVTDCQSFDDADEAKKCAEKTGGVIYTQVDTDPDCDACPKHNTPQCEDDPCDNVAYEKGLHYVNRTGFYQVVLGVKA
jgi:DNA-directed RNA polymerase subunit M/transcription elongation factor TFIIS